MDHISFAFISVRSNSRCCHMRVMVLLFVLVAGCGSPLDLLTGGGPNVAANTQIGAENRQALTAGVSSETQQTLDAKDVGKIEQSTGQTGVRTDRVETLVVQERVPSWIWISWALLLMLDSPLRWPGQIWKRLRRVR